MPPKAKRAATRRTVTRKQAALTGYGAYRSKPKSRKSKTQKEASLGRAILENGGALAAGAFGLPPGIGRMAGSALSSIVGLGDYEVKKNVFMEGRLPKMINVPKAGGTVIRFQEYLSDIYSNPDIANPGGFHTSNYIINAANQLTFPWLSQLASNYEQYYFEGIVFEFRSTSADALNSTNTALGSVMMATQYDVSDAVFNSKSEMLNYEFSNSVKPSENCLHMVECAPNQTVLSGLYTLNGVNPPGTDARLFNLGRFTIATVGFQAANVNIGELHVTYQVRLVKPKLYAALGNMNDYALLFSNTYSDAIPMPDSFTRGAQNTFAPDLVSGTCTLPGSAVIKTYRVEIFWLGTNAAPCTITDPVMANCTLNSLGKTPLSGTTSNNCALTMAFSTLGNSKSCSFSIPASNLPVIPNGSSAFILRIFQVPQGGFA